ncbi:hypothetical protein E2C01_021776 [Portunus trituberculatus]|uniref:Uncharacterized protein n=1 Tax=Portunus trituberculatus TaxID=210409 RepID=A0A5B7E5T9_PORTR|nr:hypothetical protein [Portunus trituberculatus]
MWRVTRRSPGRCRRPPEGHGGRQRIGRHTGQSRAPPKRIQCVLHCPTLALLRRISVAHRLFIEAERIIQLYSVSVRVNLVLERAFTGVRHITRRGEACYTRADPSLTAHAL